MVDDEASSVPSFEDAMMDDARVVRVEVSNWKFTPSIITAEVGEKVKVAFVGVVGNHGVAIPDLGIDMKFNEGVTATMDLPTDTAGTFPFRCNVLCREGHRAMTGAIVIE